MVKHMVGMYNVYVLCIYTCMYICMHVWRSTPRRFLTGNAPFPSPPPPPHSPCSLVPSFSRSPLVDVFGFGFSSRLRITGDWLTSWGYFFSYLATKQNGVSFFVCSVERHGVHILAWLVVVFFGPVAALCFKWIGMGCAWVLTI